MGDRRHVEEGQELDLQRERRVGRHRRRRSLLKSGTVLERRRIAGESMLKSGRTLRSGREGAKGKGAMRAVHWECAGVVGG